jgi:hypothetical protein
MRTGSTLYRTTTQGVSRPITLTQAGMVRKKMTDYTQLMQQDYKCHSFGSLYVVHDE